MREDSLFLQRYFDAFDRIEGWFSPDAALMFMAYAGLNRSNGIAGHVLEIGVFHGLSAIALAALRGQDARFVAVDLFETHNVSSVHFDRNMTAFFGNTGFIRRLAISSNALTPDDLGDGFSLCHVDGGHSAAETYADLELCVHVLLPGGLLALDDYFNPLYPGVCEGAIKFWLAHPTALRPIALGFNKVLFQKEPAGADLNSQFDQAFSIIPHNAATLWEKPVHAFSAFRPFIDHRASTPLQLVPHRTLRLDAELRPEASNIAAARGERFRMPVRVTNRSTIPFDASSEHTRFGLSYHLLSGDGAILQFDNPRDYFVAPLQPGETRTVDLVLDAPQDRGRYEVELDIVWEGVTWLKQRGLAAPRLTLTVE
jgi:Methyltransferase domain